MSGASYPARAAGAAAILALAIAGVAMSIGRTPIPPPAAGPVIEPRLIDINSAGPEELDLLPRIGPALASRIIEDRRANGPFRSLDDLDRVRGIGPLTVEKLRGLAEALPPE